MKETGIPIDGAPAVNILPANIANRWYAIRKLKLLPIGCYLGVFIGVLPYFLARWFGHYPFTKLYPTQIGICVIGIGVYHVRLVGSPYFPMMRVPVVKNKTGARALPYS